jgi:hypothetical protein
MEYPNGSIYVGGFAEGLFSGHGTLYEADGSLTSTSWEHGKAQGRGHHVFPDGSVFVGKYSKGMRWGTGKIVYPDGRVLTAKFRGKPHGEATLAHPDGSEEIKVYRRGRVVATRSSKDPDPELVRRLSESREPRAGEAEADPQGESDAE